MQGMQRISKNKFALFFSNFCLNQKPEFKEAKDQKREMKGGWIQKRKKEDSGPVVEEDDVEEEEERLSVVTQYGSSLSSSHRQPSSQHHVTEVPDSQELPASQDVIESSHQNSFSTPSYIPEGTCLMIINEISIIIWEVLLKIINTHL